jgi:hypothetical protein
MLFPKPKRIKHPGKAAEKRCMAIWGELVRLRASGRCEYCGSMDRIQAHHVFTRSIAALKYFLANGVCLCAGHHIFFAHKKPHDFRDWIVFKRGQAWWDNLIIRRSIRGKLDMQLIELALKQEAKIWQA